jgi:hypothetical protein
MNEVNTNDDYAKLRNKFRFELVMELLDLIDPENFPSINNQKVVDRLAEIKEELMEKCYENKN